MLWTLLHVLIKVLDLTFHTRQVFRVLSFKFCVSFSGSWTLGAMHEKDLRSPASGSIFKALGLGSWVLYLRWILGLGFWVPFMDMPKTDLYYENINLRT